MDMHSGFISQVDLRNACLRLTAQFEGLRNQSLAMRFLRTGDHLSITKPHAPHSIPENVISDCSMHEEMFEGIEAVDEAAVLHQGTHWREAAVEYHIFHSVSYQVPVLYFHLNNVRGTSHDKLDMMYRQLVPKRSRRTLKDSGVLGAASMANHPISGIPCFWIHPCQTAEAMRVIMGSMSRDVNADAYLMAWIGLVGSVVGLTLPKDIASPNQ